MNKPVGVLAIASVITLGAYFYLNAGWVQTNEGSPAAATVSTPVKAQAESEKPDQKSEEKTEKPTPKLESFEGLDEESSIIFNGEAEGQSSTEDPLKAATE